jgi:hypothetical protein
MRRHAQLVDPRFIAVEAVTAVFAVGTEARAGGHVKAYFLRCGAWGMVGTARAPQPRTTLWISSG